MSSVIEDEHKTLQTSLRILFRSLVETNGSKILIDLVTFSTVATLTYQDVIDLPPEARMARFETALGTITPLGSTCFDLAFDLAFDLRCKECDIPGFIIFLTDGVPTLGLNGDDLEDHCRHNFPLWTSIFTLGIGEEISILHLCRLGEFAAIFDRREIPLRLGEICSRIETAIGFKARILVEGETYPFFLGTICPLLNYRLAFDHPISSAILIYTDLFRHATSPYSEVDRVVAVDAVEVPVILPGLDKLVSFTRRQQQIAQRRDTYTPFEVPSFSPVYFSPLIDAPPSPPPLIFSTQEISSLNHTQTPGSIEKGRAFVEEFDTAAENLSLFKDAASDS